jgi:ligand-binding sensor domain-containing protein
MCNVQLKKEKPLKTQNLMLNLLNSVLLVLFGLLMASAVGAADLVFSPAAPTVEVGQQINLSVSGTSGAVTWTPSKGQIQGTGKQVTYLAPAQAGVDAIVVIDGAGNVGTVKIIVTAKQLVSLENANWEVFTNRDVVHALALSKDKETMWVGTNGGLEQRDASTGELVRVFTNLDGLPDNRIFNLENDGSGGLWVGTEVGLAYRSVSGEWTVYTTDNSGLPSNWITALENDGSGGLWIGTKVGLAYRSVSGEWTVYNQDNSVWPNDYVLDIESDGSGGLWIGNNDGLVYRSVGGEWTVYNQENSGLPDNDIRVLESDGSGGLWVGTNDFGLAYRGVSGEWTIYTTDNSGLPDNHISELKSDGSGGLWIGTWSDNGLAYRSVSGEWTVYNQDNSGLPDNHISELKSDGSGGLWVVTTSSGLSYGLVYRSASGKWTVSNQDNSGLPDNNVFALKSDGSGGLWTGTGNWSGLGYRSTSGEWTVYNQDNSGLPYNMVVALESDDSGGLWISVANISPGHLVSNNINLTYRSVSGEWTVYNQDNSGLPDNKVFALKSDGSGGLWVGTSSGLAYRSVSGEWTVYNQDNSGLPDKNVYALESDVSGGLWIWTDGGLAYRSVSGEWTVYNQDNSGLPSNDIRALESDGSGGLWIGTLSGGLAYRSVNGEWTVYNQDNSGLPDNRIRALESDGSGGLWMGTDGGLAYRSVSGEWTVYTTDNSGLPDNEVSVLESDGSGGLWIGTDGIAHLTFSQKNTLCTDLNDAECQNVLTDKRAAILIHPRGQGTGYNQEVSIEFMATHAYRVLHNRGYDNDEIYFLSHKSDVDFNGDGKPDHNVVDGPVTISDRATGIPSRDLTRADVQQAFDWAKQKGQLDQPLVLIFVDHALTGKLRLDPFNEVLTAQDLGSMLTDYQNTTGSQAVVILEACHTGSLVSGLAGQNRLIVTSTAEDLAYYDNLGSFSFSKFFFDNLRRGENFFDAFQTVKGKLPTYGFPFDKQAPQLDDDGDGQANTSNDGRLARKWCLNGCFGALSGEITLEAETVAGTVTAGQTLPLVVRAGITEGRIKRVWALVMTPEAAKQRNEEGFSLIPTPVVNLSQQPEDASRWQSSFNGFKYRGDYVVTFMAEDNEGMITAAPPVALTLPTGPEVPEINNAGAKAILNQAVFHDGDMFKVTLPALPAGHVQYVGVGLPDGSIFVLAELNGFVPFDGATLPVWQGGEVAIEVSVNAGIPRGEYVVYLLRVPVGVEPLAHSEQWVLGQSKFRVE